jgi:hypothetical protein
MALPGMQRPANPDLAPQPSVLSLSKDSPFFVLLRATLKKQGQCFDKLSMDGFGVWGWGWLFAAALSRPPDP